MKNAKTRSRAALAVRCVVISLCAGLAGLALAQNGPQGFVGKKINVKDLVLPHLKKTGEKDWVLRAKQGVSSGNSFLLKTVYIVVYRKKDEGGNTEMRTPECIYDRSTRIGRSDKRINIRTGNMVMDGKGFDLDGKGKKVVIRSRVRVKILKNDRSLFGNPEKDKTKPKNQPAKKGTKPIVNPPK